MYDVVIFLHSWLRWVVLAAAVLVLLRSVSGIGSGRAYAAGDRKLGLLWMISFDVQFLLGLILYFWLSPITAVARATPGWIKVPQLRFWMMEHSSMMFLAVLALHIGRVLVKKAGTDRARHSRTLATVVISTILVMVGMPWPGTQNARPLFRSHTAAPSATGNGTGVVPSEVEPARPHNPL